MLNGIGDSATAGGTPSDPKVSPRGQSCGGRVTGPDFLPFGMARRSGSSNSIWFCAFIPVAPAALGSFYLLSDGVDGRRSRRAARIASPGSGFFAWQATIQGKLPLQMSCGLKSEAATAMRIVSLRHSACAGSVGCRAFPLALRLTISSLCPSNAARNRLRESALDFIAAISKCGAVDHARIHFDARNAQPRGMVEHIIEGQRAEAVRYESELQA